MTLVPLPAPGGRSLRSAVLGHDNDYGIDPASADLRVKDLAMSVVVPYYETGWIAVECVARIDRALDYYQAQHGIEAACQIVVVDDGSTRHPFPDLDIARIHLVRHDTNEGRSAARNSGLRASEGFDVAAFIDSDVLVPEDHVCRIAELWDPGAPEQPARPAVVAGLFSTLRADPGKVDLDRAVALSRVGGDWRWSCRYQPSWAACTGDWGYVGRSFRLVGDTDEFRCWSGMVGPWCLANMVLGGSFAVPVPAALDVGGFDPSFAAYGFTETTLVARLIADGYHVIPQVKSAAVHVEGNPAHHSQDERSSLLRSAHHRFFTQFLDNAAAHDAAA